MKDLRVEVLAIFAEAARRYDRPWRMKWPHTRYQRRREVVDAWTERRDRRPLSQRLRKMGLERMNENWNPPPASPRPDLVAMREAMSDKARARRAA